MFSSNSAGRVRVKQHRIKFILKFDSVVPLFSSTWIKIIRKTIFEAQGSKKMAENGNENDLKTLKIKEYCKIFAFIFALKK